MKFSCHKSILLDGINTAQRAVAAKGVQPILQGILIDAEGTSLMFSATDLEIGIQRTMDAEIEDPGSVVVPARLFGDVVRRLPDTIVTCETVDNKLKVRYLDSSIDILTMDPDEFPVFPPVDAPTFLIPLDVVKEGLRKVLIAISLNDNRKVLTGVFTRLSGDKLEFTCTDGYRAAFFSESVSTGQDLTAILPGKSANEILRLLSGEEISIAVLSGQLVFEDGGTKIYSRIIDGQFPDAKRILNQKYNSHLSVEIEQLKGAIDRAELFVEGESKAIKLEGDSTLTVTSVGARTGGLFERVYTEFTGEPIDITLNAKFISEALKVLEKPKCEIDFSGPLTAFKIQEENYTFIGLPIRTR